MKKLSRNIKLFLTPFQGHSRPGIANSPLSIDHSPLTIHLLVLLYSCFLLTSCEKDFNIKIEAGKPQLVVEAYINNQMREYNYVILSRSLDYLSPNFQSTPVSKASVFITEGEIINNKYSWNQASRVQLVEVNLPMIPANFTSGIYFDTLLMTNAQHALLGAAGKSYLLEITEGDNQYSAVTTLLPPVPIDSLTVGFPYIDENDDNNTKVRITNHYKDPDTLNNTQFYYYRFFENRNSFGWGGLSKSRTGGTDDLTNGQYIHLTHPRGFAAPDTINYFMASVTRDVYNFWDSYNKARDNNGPFATPVTLSSNIQGTNVTGCFTGLSLSSKTIILRK